MKHPPSLLIDIGIIAYKAASAATKNISFDGEESLALYIGPLTDDLIFSLSKFVRVVDEMREKRRHR